MSFPTLRRSTNTLRSYIRQPTCVFVLSCPRGASGCTRADCKSSADSTVVARPRQGTDQPSAHSSTVDPDAVLPQFVLDAGTLARNTVHSPELSIPNTTPVHLLEQCTKSSRAIIPMCLSKGKGTSAGEAPIAGGVKQHVYADMSISGLAHLEPTSTTASGAGHQSSSVNYSVTGDHPGFVHVASLSVTSISGCRVPSTSRHGSVVLYQSALMQAGVSPLNLTSCACRPVLMAGAREFYSVTGDHPGFVHVASPSVTSISGCRVSSTSRHGSLVLHQLALTQAGVSPLKLATCASRPVLMAGARESSSGAHPTSHALRILANYLKQWPPRPSLPSPSRQ